MIFREFCFVLREEQRSRERRGRERISSRLHTKCRAGYGVWSYDPEIMTWAQIKSWMLTGLSHTDAPTGKLFRINPKWSHHKVTSPPHPTPVFCSFFSFLFFFLSIWEDKCQLKLLWYVPHSICKSNHHALHRKLTRWYIAITTQ